MATPIIDITDNSREVIAKVGKMTAQTLERFTDESVETIKQNAPYDTGHHRGSIDHASIASGGLVRKVFSASNTRTGRSYGAYLEYGTSKMAARPHFLPGLQKTISVFSRRGVWG